MQWEALLDCQVEKGSLLCLKPQCSGAVSKQRGAALGMEMAGCGSLLRGEEGVPSALGRVLGSHGTASAATAPW